MFFEESFDIVDAAKVLMTGTSGGERGIEAEHQLKFVHRHAGVDGRRAVEPFALESQQINIKPHGSNMSATAKMGSEDSNIGVHDNIVIRTTQTHLAIAPCPAKTSA